MSVLAILGLAVIFVCATYGTYVLAKSISFKPTVERYRYVQTYDEEGNEITKVIDLQDKNQD